jgi:hypothetical protein
VLTGENITDRQIRELRMAAVRADDWQLVSTCTAALKVMSKSDQRWLLEPYRTPALKVDALAKEARAKCADVYNGLAKAVAGVK